jgi:ribosome maturation protein SDO1
MTEVISRIKVKGKLFEIKVDLDKAILFKKQGKGSSRDFLVVDTIFTDIKKGFKPPIQDLKDAFGTEDHYTIAEKIVKNGEVQLPQEYRDKMREEKIKQVVDFLAKNCLDPRTGAPYTPERIEESIKQAGAKIDNRAVSEQALSIIKDLEKILPIKIETKKISIIVPPAHTGKVYGLLKSFNPEKEDWQNDGSLKVIINLPAGLQLEFYDKLNNITHGAALTKEIKKE